MKHSFVLLFSLASYLIGYAQTNPEEEISNHEHEEEDSTRLIIGFTNQVEALELKDLDINSNCAKGLLTPSLYRKLPIFRDGLRPSDIIIDIDGICTESLNELTRYIKTKNDKKISILCYSDDTTKTIITELVTLREFNVIKQEFMSQVDIKEDGTFSVSQELTHTIDMNTTGIGTLTWTIGIRWLHDALMEDLLDKIENQFSNKSKRTEWNNWVKFLRKVLK